MLMVSDSESFEGDEVKRKKSGDGGSDSDLMVRRMW